MVFKKLWNSLSKTRTTFGSRLKALFSRRALDTAFLEELEEILYSADLGSTTTDILNELQAAYQKREIAQPQQAADFLKKQLLQRLHSSELHPAAQPPTVILVAGVNGSGKTTSIAKLAGYLKRQGASVMVAACDTFRAAAVEQLTIWSQRLSIPIIKQASGADPASVAFDAVTAAQARKIDYLLVDTAGRLHTQKNLMAELEKICRVLQKKIPAAPHAVMLILDATNGQNAIRQAEEFSKAIKVTGLFVTKLDGSAKGGALFGVQKQLGIPIQFIGVGESLEDIEPFDQARATEFVDSVLGQNPDA